MTLRRRLVALMVALVAAGLAAFGLVSYSLYSHSQYQRLDDQLQSLTPLLGRLVTPPASDGSDVNPTPGAGPGGGRGGTPLPPDSYVELRTATGHIVTGRTLACYGACSKPLLPASLAPGSPNGRLLTVPATDGSSSFRVLVRPYRPPGGPPPDAGASLPDATYAGDVVVAAVPLGDVTRSLDRLVIVDLAVGAVFTIRLPAATWPSNGGAGAAAAAGVHQTGAGEGTDSQAHPMPSPGDSEESSAH